MDIEIRAITPEEFTAFQETMGIAFSFDPKPEDEERFRHVFEFDRSVAAFDGDQIVGTGGAFSFDLTIPGETTLEQLVVATLSDNSQGTYLVMQAEQPAGILSLGDITRVPRHLWSRTQAKEVMKSFGETVQIYPDTPLLTALQEMESENLRLIPVVDGLNVLGVLSRERVLNYLRLRTELGS